MEVIGKIIHKLPLQQGTSKAGTAWSKQEYVLETINEPYPKKVHFDFFGERANQYPLNEGDVITLSFDIDSHEFNGRWFTNIRGWKAVPYDPAQVQPQAQPGGMPMAQPQYGAPQQYAPTSAAPAPAPTAAPAPAAGPAPAPDLGQTTEDDLPF